ncbi:TenA family protein [Halorientalis halophila]|uniref:TenA family protein n=1 Tax=Halorientalis halophila TaxID=3108499 RepID=UPI003008E7CA
MSVEEGGPDRYTTRLRERTGPDWTAATEHRFTEELAAGEIADDAMARYLVQDFRFVETLASVVGYAAAQAHDTAAKAELGEFLTVVATDETDYFERSFDALDVPARERTDPEPWPVTQAFEDLLLSAARDGGYAETLSVLVPVEWVYLTWADRAADGERPDRFYLDEWIEIHAVEAFADFVEWLRAELDRVGPELPDRRQRRVARNFERAVALEVEFFDAVYEG